MSGLAGALFSGVSGINANTQAMTMISDNIVNQNTTGYKGSVARFSTLVTNSITSGLYTSGGVRSLPLQVMDKQGLLQGSSTSTDIAVNGKGFLVVSTSTSPSLADGSFVFTRAGSFRTDKDGNLRNAAGNFMMAWPFRDAAVDNAQTITVNGRAIQFGANGLPINLTTDTAEVVNLSTLTGTADATENVRPRINLDATNTIQTARIGAAATANTYKSDGSGGGNIGLGSVIDGGAATATIAAIDASNSMSVPGGITGLVPDFQRSVTVFDTQGVSHSLTMSFIRSTTANEWYYEVTAPDADTTVHPDNLVAFGRLRFKSDGSLDVTNSRQYGANISDQTTTPPTAVAAPNFTLLNDINTGFDIKWNTTTTGASPTNADAQEITMNWGTDGQVNGMSQFEGDSVLFSQDVDGAVFGAFSGVTIDDEGFVVANFANGISQRTHRISMAVFDNDAGLANLTGNAYQTTAESGNPSFVLPNTGVAGKIAPSALEASNVDIGSEFSQMILTQRAFSASSRVITAADTMLEELLRIVR